MLVSDPGNIVRSVDRANVLALYDVRYTGEGSRLVQALYTPLALACQVNEPLGNWVEWYIGFWT